MLRPRCALARFRIEDTQEFLTVPAHSSLIESNYWRSPQLQVLLGDEDSNADVPTLPPPTLLQHDFPGNWDETLPESFPMRLGLFREDEENSDMFGTRLTRCFVQMMFISGETAEPSAETTWVIEEVVREQVVEMVGCRPDQSILLNISVTTSQLSCQPQRLQIDFDR